MKIINQFRHILWQLLRRDMRVFRRGYFDDFINTTFVLFTTVIVFGYFMGRLGLKLDYGTFILLGAIGSFGILDIIGKTGILIGDIEGDRTINYFLTLPLPSWLVFANMGLSYAIRSFFMTLPLFVWGKIFLPTQFDLSIINYPRLIIIFVTLHLFFGYFAIWVASMIKHLKAISSLYFRIINPMFMFGCYLFPWREAFNIDKAIGYILLINPMTYVQEGIRAAALGQEGYIPFWYSFFALWFFILVLGTHGILRLKKRLDCI